jgi:hypothetical protein
MGAVAEIERRDPGASNRAKINREIADQRPSH